MKKTLTTSEVANELFNGGENGFSYAGARALAEHLEEIEESIGGGMELDVVAIRCDYAEYESLAACRAKYGLPAEQDGVDEKTREFINDRGTLIEFDGGIIVSSF